MIAVQREPVQSSPTARVHPNDLHPIYEGPPKDAAMTYG
jgi:hypothetical protein